MSDAGEGAELDVSELLADFRALFRASPTPLLVVTPPPAFRIIAVNDAYLRATMTDRDEITGRGIFDVFPDNPDDPEANGVRNLRESFERCVATRRADAMPVQKYDIRRPESGGGGFVQRWWSPLNTPVINETGQVTCIIHHVDDVTEVVQLRAQGVENDRLLRAERSALATARDARAEAEAANRAKSDFLAVMSHELRTPLNAIAGYAELLAIGVHGDLSESQAGAVERIQRAQRHLLGLINGVLNYARIEAGSVSYDVRPISVGDVLATCEMLVAPQAAARSHRIVRHDCDPALAVLADREKVEQIVLNLLSNASKFGDPGGTITIGCGADGATAHIRIGDTGYGIPESELERVFQPFVQLDARLTRSQEGTGLGLAISRDLARAMGGDLTVESEPGRGSTFTLTLSRA